MKVSVESVTQKFFDTNAQDIQEVNSGGEGSVYKIPDACLKAPQHGIPLVKIYHEEILKSDKLEARSKKGINLASKYVIFKSNFLPNTNFTASQFAFPENNAINDDTKTYVGFSMKDLGRYHDLSFLKYENGKIADIESAQEISDDEAVNLIYDMTYGIFMLHKCGIVIGDLNESNILYDHEKKLPLFLDIDTAQFENFACDAHKEQDGIIDPLIKRKRLDGAESKEGAYEYSEDSDTFALAVHAYRLLTGRLPVQFMGLCDINTVAERTKNKIFFIKLLLDENFRKEKQIELRKNAKLEARLQEIQNKYPEIYQYFVDVFVYDKRYYITEKLPVTDFRNPDYEIEDIGEEIEQTQDATTAIKIRFAQSINDSAEFEFFVNTLGYNYKDFFMREVDDIDLGTDYGWFDPKKYLTAAGGK